VIQAWLLGSAAPRTDVRVRSAPAKLPRWISAVVLLIGVITVLTSLVLAAFGSFAALRIAHGYGSAGERAPAAQPFASSPPQRTPGGGADGIILVPSGPPVVASSDPTESELDLKPGNMDSAAALAAELGGSAGEKQPSSARAAASGSPGPAGAVPAVPAPGSATDNPAGSIDRIALAAPTSETTAVAPQQAKRHHAVKHHPARKRVQRVARRPAYPTAAASPFQPMFSSP
jgi:hypothetical protein